MKKMKDHKRSSSCALSGSLSCHRTSASVSPCELHLFVWILENVRGSGAGSWRCCARPSGFLSTATPASRKPKLSSMLHALGRVKNIRQNGTPAPARNTTSNTKRVYSSQRLWPLSHPHPLPPLAACREPALLRRAAWTLSITRSRPVAPQPTCLRLRGPHNFHRHWPNDLGDAPEPPGKLSGVEDAIAPDRGGLAAPPCPSMGKGRVLGGPQALLGGRS